MTARNLLIFILYYLHIKEIQQISLDKKRNYTIINNI